MRSRCGRDDPQWAGKHEKRQLVKQVSNEKGPRCSGRTGWETAEWAGQGRMTGNHGE